MSVRQSVCLYIGALCPCDHYAWFTGPHCTVSTSPLLDMGPHWTGTWDLVAITGNQFKLVHFRHPPPLVLTCGCYQSMYGRRKRVVRILLERFLVIVLLNHNGQFHFYLTLNSKKADVRTIVIVRPVKGELTHSQGPFTSAENGSGNGKDDKKKAFK